MRIYIYAAEDGTAYAYESLKDLCTDHSLPYSTAKGVLSKSDLFKPRQGGTISKTAVNVCHGRKRPKNARNWAKKEY